MSAKSKRTVRPPLRLEDYEVDSLLLPAAPPSVSPKKESPPSSASTKEQLELERMRNENLKLELQIKQTELQVAKLTIQDDRASSPAADIRGAPFLQDAATSQHEDLLSHLHFPGLHDLRQRQKAKSFLPSSYLFSSKGNIEFDKLDISEFLVGFLEMLSAHPEKLR